ncbi:hypothetical protein [Staphylococcus phage vB_StaM_SA1]|nr:hypothetical protein [Staphylococcus phage vB_StaM_SA1]
MLKNIDVEINQDIINSELLKTKYLEEAVNNVIKNDFVLNLRYLKDNMISSWSFDEVVATFEDIETFYDPDKKVNIVFNVNDKEIKYTLNEEVQEMLYNFMIKKSDDERACSIIKSIVEFEYFKKVNKKGNLDLETISLLMDKVEELKIKYNISYKQAKKLYIAF